MKVIVLDFTTGEVHIYSLKHDEDAEEFIENSDHNLSNIQWMTTDKQIVIHN